MQDSLRRSYLSQTLFGPLAVLAAAATFRVTRPLVISGAQFSLSDSGGGGGATSVVVKVNGAQIIPTLTVGAGAAVVTANAPAASGTVPGYPSGCQVKVGDVVTVDVTAVAANPPRGGTVALDVTQVDLP